MRGMAGIYSYSGLGARIELPLDNHNCRRCFHTLSHPAKAGMAEIAGIRLRAITAASICPDPSSCRAEIGSPPKSTKTALSKRAGNNMERGVKPTANIIPTKTGVQTAAKSIQLNVFLRSLLLTSAIMATIKQISGMIEKDGESCCHDTNGVIVCFASRSYFSQNASRFGANLV
jgi:hypothetical protein